MRRYTPECKKELLKTIVEANPKRDAYILIKVELNINSKMQYMMEKGLDG